MKSYSRKFGSVKSAGSFSTSPSATASAAAVSVTKFGQATFTSVRRNDYENGSSKHNYVPLKKSIAEEETITKNQSETKPAPKVYKFFKSRSGGTTPQAPLNKSYNNSTPKPLVLNSSTRDDGTKRVSSSTGKSPNTYSRNRTDKSNITKTVNISENKSCEIQVCGDKTIKKIISPTKTTQFIIRNNTSVRGATLKPVSTPSNVPSISKGIRASRRLKGIEPEAVSAARKSQTIHVMFNKGESSDIEQFDATKNSTNGNNCTTLIEEVKDDYLDEDSKVQDEQMELDDSNMGKDIEFTSDSKIDNECKSEDEVEATTKDIANKLDAEESLAPVEDLNKESITHLPQSQSSNDAETNLNTNSEVDFQITKKEEESEFEKLETKSVLNRPKKKIFFNRDRSKVEFNTKSFFASTTKDEFDVEMDTNNTTSTAPPVNAEKKNGHDNEEDDQYIKLKRIKKAHQCHDLGETEQFDEDIKYYLSGIVSTNPKSMRCLSIIGLSQQAMRPEFRMHLRAHDDMPRIIKALMDAPQDPYLALCTATLMFVYNQDRLTMDIDPNALSLMLELLETRSDECNQVEEKQRAKVVPLVEEMKNKGHAKYLKLNEITAGKLAMETLLGLTSKRAGDWFKVELRKMKGIDFIVNTVLRCAENYSEEGQMIKIDRCMHVLENVTFNNVENQLYITNYNDSKFISVCISLLENCKSKIINSTDSKVFLSAFFSILRVFTNLTSESVDGCKAFGTFSGIMELLLESVFELPSFIMPDQRFDLMVIILCLCINLVEFCEHIRQLVITSSKYTTKLIEFLFKKIEEAAQVEQQTDHLLESHETVQMTEAMQDNLLMQMISKSGTHMEHSLLSACVCLLFGCCIQDNEENMNILKESLPNMSFDPLIEMLEKLRDFAHLADIMTQKGKERVQRVLQIFKMYKK
ncbi:hypothetical protein BLOT_003203 [Blomia tropicalis]|nr:hypothetical protein BLOT_003203 [Blomia tropicalis]